MHRKKTNWKEEKKNAHEIGLRLYLPSIHSFSGGISDYIRTRRLFFCIFALGLFLRLLLKIIGMTEKGAESLGNLTFFSNSRLSSSLDQWNRTLYHTLLQKKRLYLVHWLNEFWVYKKEKFLEFKSIHSTTKLRGIKIELRSKFFSASKSIHMVEAK